MLKEYVIIADINALWIKMPIYRLRVDEELMCERTFWINPEKLYIEENIIVELDSGKHTLVLEQVDPTLGKVWIKKAKIIDVETDTAQEITPRNIDFDKLQEITFSV
jgi:hypothetical protein